MKALVIYCHPNPESFTAAVRNAVLAGLAAGGHEARVIDLYGEGFDPVMSREEREGYHTPGENERPVAAHLAALRWCDALIFIYPTWWYGPPAMLKGWLERVFVPHATFTMPTENKPIGRLMGHIRVIAAVSTLGSPWWWWRVVGQPGRRILLFGIGALLSPKARKIWLALHRMDSVGEGQRKRFLRQVEARFRAP